MEVIPKERLAFIAGGADTPPPSPPPQPTTNGSTTTITCPANTVMTVTVLSTETVTVMCIPK